MCFSDIYALSSSSVKQTSIDSALNQLASERDRASGVDVNEEAAKLIAFQRMYQALARFMGVQSQALEYLMDVL